MKIFFTLLLLLLATGVLAQDSALTPETGTFSVQPAITAGVITGGVAEPTGTEYLDFFGISLEMFGLLSGILFFIVEGVKRKLPKVFTGGENKWRTDVLLIALAFLLAIKVFYPDPMTIITCTIGLFMGGAGIHTLKKSIIK